MEKAAQGAEPKDFTEVERRGADDSARGAVAAIRTGKCEDGGRLPRMVRKALAKVGPGSGWSFEVDGYKASHGIQGGGATGAAATAHGVLTLGGERFEAEGEGRWVVGPSAPPGAAVGRAVAEAVVSAVFMCFAACVERSEVHRSRRSVGDPFDIVDGRLRGDGRPVWEAPKTLH